LSNLLRFLLPSKEDNLQLCPSLSYGKAWAPPLLQIGGWILLRKKRLAWLIRWTVRWLSKSILKIRAWHSRLGYRWKWRLRFNKLCQHILPTAVRNNKHHQEQWHSKFSNQWTSFQTIKLVHQATLVLFKNLTQYHILQPTVSRQEVYQTIRIPSKTVLEHKWPHRFFAIIHRARVLTKRPLV